MTASQWKSKLIFAIDDFWKLHNRNPGAIYMGFLEDRDYIANTSLSDLSYKGSDLYFQGIEVIRVNKQSYFRVV